MFAGKPIIGVVGGIGSGKSFVADLCGELGCLVIHSDKLIEEAYNNQEIRQALSDFWGNAVFTADGNIDRKAIARKIFSDAPARIKLQGLLYPVVDQRRREMMVAAADDRSIPAFVWDSPLLVETGLDRQCDAIFFVDAPLELRLPRISKNRGWDAEELARRENLQYPLRQKQRNIRICDS